MHIAQHFHLELKIDANVTQYPDTNVKQYPQKIYVSDVEIAAPVSEAPVLLQTVYSHIQITGGVVDCSGLTSWLNTALS